MEHMDSSSLVSLISNIHTAASDFLEEKLKEYGLPNMVSSHGFILYRLSLAERLTMGELAQLVNRDKSTVTVLIRKLEAAGFVEREVSEKDSRVVYIKLTPQGREYNDKTKDISRQLIERCYQGFSPEERQTTFALLKRIFNNFKN